MNIKDKLEQSAREYYTGEKPTFTDEQYDHLASKHDVGVGYTPINKTTRHHPHRMYSLFKHYQYDQFYDAISKMNDTSNIFTLKMDGLAISIQYKKGKYAGSTTRGNGTDGVVIDELIEKLISHPDAKIPHTLPVDEDVEVHGELYMTYASLDELHSVFGAGEGGYANPRMAVSAIVNANNTDLIEFASFMPYRIYREIPIATYSDEIEMLTLFGFDTAPLCMLELSPLPTKDELNYILRYHFAKETRYPSDGVVVRVNNNALAQRLGHTAKAPKYAYALKASLGHHQSAILNFIYTLDTKGNIRVVADIFPVDINGTKVSRVNLGTLATVVGKGYHIDDEIAVHLKGHAIPSISGVTSKSPSPRAHITHCPSCNSELVNHKCTGGAKCPGTVDAVKRLLYSRLSGGKNTITDVSEIHEFKDFFTKTKLKKKYFNNVPEAEITNERIIRDIMTALSYGEVYTIVSHIGSSDCHLPTSAMQDLLDNPDRLYLPSSFIQSFFEDWLEFVSIR